MVFPEAVRELGQYTSFRQSVAVPILANITEFGHTPLFTTAELGAAGVDIVLYCCSAYRAMNKGAETVYKALLSDGHQHNVLDIMQTRVELYDYLGYHDYERKLDELFASGKELNGKREEKDG
jgi:methylisocitrate lyase